MRHPGRCGVTLRGWGNGSNDVGRIKDFGARNVGSSAIESDFKAIVDQRLKLSGMRWNVRGATGIVTLRCQEASG